MPLPIDNMWSLCGSILSVMLFAVRINSIATCLKPDTEGSLFVDDFSISYSAKFMHTIEDHLQEVLTKLECWVDKNGFKCFPSKTVCMHFCRKRGLHHDPNLLLFGNTILVVKTFEFLGLTLDSKYFFINHIQNLTNRCRRALDILRILANTKWGSDRDSLLTVYQALIC